MGLSFFTSTAKQKISVAALLLAIVASQSAFAAFKTEISILHTNDLHSHFRPEQNEQNLGGIARLKTKIDELKNHPRWKNGTLLVDAGDWSEGQIYYTLDLGASTLDLMNQMGYNVTLVGNHDWLNGPGTFLEAVSKSKSFPHATTEQPMTLLATNVDTSAYAHKKLWHENVKAVSIQTVHGVKIAFIGLVTIGHEYDDFLKPIKITDAVEATEQMVKALKEKDSSGNAKADLVVAISHNSINDNANFLTKVPDLDFVIGAHDHIKRTTPLKVIRPGKPTGFVVETGCWGRFLGQVVIEANFGDDTHPEKVTGWAFKGYRLHQMDSTVKEDPSILSKVEAMEASIRKIRGDRFFDDVSIQSDVHLVRSGLENRMLNFATQSYLHAVNSREKLPRADLAWDQTNFVYGPLFTGALHPVDFFNASPAVYNPRTKKTWTLKMMKIKGEELMHLLEIAFGTESLLNQNYFSSSGIRFIYDPILINAKQKAAVQISTEEGVNPDRQALYDTRKETIKAIAGHHIRSKEKGLVRDVLINGFPLEDSETYSLVVSQGIVDAINFANNIANEETTGILNKIATVGLNIVEYLSGGKLINYTGLLDTGIQGYEAMDEYSRFLTRDQFRLDKISAPLDGRARSAQPDLGVNLDEIYWEPAAHFELDHSAKITVVVKNFGASPSLPGAKLRISGNLNGSDQTKYVREQLFGEDFAIPVIPGIGPDRIIHQHVFVIESAKGITGSNHLYPIQASIINSQGEVNDSNDRAVRVFQNL